MKCHFLWIIQWPLVLVLEEVLKSLSLSLLSMQLVVSDTPIISVFSLVSHELYSPYLFNFPQLKVPACSAILCRNLFFVTLSPRSVSSRSAVPEMKGSDLWLGLSLSNGIFFSLLLSVHMPIILNVWFVFFFFFITIDCWKWPFYRTAYCNTQVLFLSDSAHCFASKTWMS